MGRIQGIPLVQALTDLSVIKKENSKNSKIPKTHGFYPLFISWPYVGDKCASLHTSHVLLGWVKTVLFFACFRACKHLGTTNSSILGTNLARYVRTDSSTAPDDALEPYPVTSMLIETPRGCQAEHGPFLCFLRSSKENLNGTRRTPKLSKLLFLDHFLWRKRWFGGTEISDTAI